VKIAIDDGNPTKPGSLVIFSEKFPVSRRLERSMTADSRFKKIKLIKRTQGNPKVKLPK